MSPNSASSASLQADHRDAVAVVTLDCARKVRVHYYLPFAIDADLFKDLGGERFELQEFSRFVDGASDHVRASSDQFHASGVLGGNRMIVTFLKEEDGEHERERARIEAVLQRHGCEGIRPVK